MKTKHLPKFASTLLLLAILNAPPSAVFGQGTAFTYQGQLRNAANPANGTYDLTFSLYPTLAGGSQIGSAVTNLAVGVTNGLFTVTLDFGANFPGANRWLAIGVRTNGGSGFTALSPLQALTPMPYAIYSAAAGNALSAGSVSAGNIVGPLTLGQLPTVLLTNGASGVDVTGTFAGNGGGLTNVPLASLTSGFFHGWGGFTLASSPAAGMWPTCLVTADVNGDGKPDMITASNDGVQVLTNNGSGGFVFAETVPNGFVISIAAADVNGDGKPDLICASEGGLTVFTNNGSGGFVLAATITATISPYGNQSLAVADLFGTGKPNLIVANWAGSTFSVFANNGGGNFSLAATVTESTDISADLQNVLVADVNGDGKPDLICATAFEPLAVTVMTNNGTGGFVISGTYGGVGDPRSLAVADVNGDGTFDIICASYGGLTVLTNNGTGGFVQSTTLGSGGGFTSVCTNDVNEDGKVDLIAANENGTLSVFTNNGTGSFALAATPAVGNDPVVVVATDVNGDGRVDLIAANYEDNTLSVLLNGPIYTGTFVGNGSGLTQLDATNLTGTVPEADLPGDVALLGAAQTFDSLNTFTDPYNQFTGIFTGNGIGLTNLYAPVLTGSVPASSLTSVPAGNLTGTIADSLLSANVTLRAGGNAVTGNQTITGGSLGIGSTAPEGLLEIQGGADGSGANDQKDIALAYRNGGFRHWIRTRHDAIVSGNPTDNAIDFFVNNSTSAVGSSAPGTGSVLALSLNGGKVGIANAEPTHLLVVGSAGSPAYCDGTTWVNGSDRNSKEAFTAIDPRTVLDKLSALPITEWQYKVEADGTRHLGPVAQDFHAAFGLNGADDKHIATIDEEGVALAAIQGLNQKLEDSSQALARENAGLKAQNDSLARQLNELATEVKALEQKK